MTSTFDPQTAIPTGSGIALANLWQGRISIRDESHGGGVTIPEIDQDVADSEADPSRTLLLSPAILAGES